jgi:ER membrane protein complex subunit 2
MALQFNLSDPSSTLHLSRKAPDLLSTAAPASRPFPFALLDKLESPATWPDHERLFLACLRAGDDKSAHLCLERLTTRFGASNQRVMGLRGIYQEAIANGPGDLEKVLQSYEKILQDDPMNVVRGHHLYYMPLLISIADTKTKDSC